MTTLFERFSSQDNLKLAYKYVQYELAHATLSVSPINHPALTAINALGDQFFVALEQYLRDEKYTPERGFFVYIPKDNLGLRPVCVLSMIDRIVYQAMLNQNILGYKIDGQLSDKTCFAHRVNDADDADSFLSPYFNGWDAFCKVQDKAFQKGYTWKTEIDVQQYYEHIPIGKLIENLTKDFGIKDEQILSLLKTQLCTWAEYPDLPKGIPQGQNASAVLGNVYLSSLDRFAEEELIGKGLRYFRYVDDIILMGKSKKDILKATERIARFLRAYNLNLNEKTRVTELTDTESINAMRILPEYADVDIEIPQDEFTRIKEQVPDIIEAISKGENVDKLELRNIKYYLKVGTEYDLVFILNLIDIIPLRPSLVIPIIQYVTEGREFLHTFGDTMDTFFIDTALWDTYNHNETSEWSKFWILKLLVSSEDVDIDEIEDEIKRTLTSKEATIFKVVGLYYETINKQKIEIETVSRAIQEAGNDVEKSLYSFFLLNVFDGIRTSTIRNHIEKTLNAPSHEINLIGCYLYQSSPRITIDDIEGTFSSYILKKKSRKEKKGTKTAGQVGSEAYFLIRKDALIPVTSPTSILGVSRAKRTRHTIELSFPEAVQWGKVTLKMKEGMHEMEIFYNGKYIETTDYIQLGFFTGKKQQKKDRQWGFLCALSVLSATDITLATADKMRAMVAVNSKLTTSTNNVHQIKSTLVKRLRALFKTDDNPFNDGMGYYDPKFKILPEPNLRREELWKTGGRLNENRSSDDTDKEAF
jgi:hypothetical protein